VNQRSTQPPLFLTRSYWIDDQKLGGEEVSAIDARGVVWLQDEGRTDLSIEKDGCAHPVVCLKLLRLDRDILRKEWQQEQ